MNYPKFHIMDIMYNFTNYPHFIDEELWMQETK